MVNFMLYVCYHNKINKYFKWSYDTCHYSFIGQGIPIIINCYHPQKKKIDFCCQCFQNEKASIFSILITCIHFLAKKKKFYIRQDCWTTFFKLKSIAHNIQVLQHQFQPLVTEISSWFICVSRCHYRSVRGKQRAVLCANCCLLLRERF